MRSDEIPTVNKIDERSAVSWVSDLFLLTYLRDLHFSYLRSNPNQAYGFETLVKIWKIESNSSTGVLPMPHLVATPKV